MPVPARRRHQRNHRERISPEDIEFHVITPLLIQPPRTEVMGNVTVHRVGFGSVSSKICLCFWLHVRHGRYTESPLAGMWAMMTMT